MAGSPARAARRLAQKVEAKALATGTWPSWERTEYPAGPPGATPGGWNADVRWIWHNGVYAVLARPVGLMTHCAIRTVSNLEPTWAELQRIKDELFSPLHSAVQIYPRRDRLIDQADMYHLWIYPMRHEFGFGLHALDERYSA